jgi:hypothetical protein
MQYVFNPFIYFITGFHLVIFFTVRKSFALVGSLIENNSFAYLELCLSLLHILKRFQLSLPYIPTASKHMREASLPERLEWVAAVPSVDLKVVFSP